MRSAYLLCLAALVCSVDAGVVNPDISALGQLFGTGDTRAGEDRRLTLSLGETELGLEAALNPYFSGAFVIAVDAEEGVEVEEAYASMVRGLPLNLSAKAGKYRLNFGKINQSHPHSYPFIRTPRVLSPDGAALLPGEESFNDIGIDLSTLIPVSDNWAITPSIDFLEGGSFHPGEETQAGAHGWLAHLSCAFAAGNTAFDAGFSATRGINNADDETVTAVLGADLKLKMIFSAGYSCVFAAEAIRKTAEITDDTGEGVHDDRNGFCTYIDNQFLTRYNAGILYEQYRDPDDRQIIDRAIKPFIGFSVLEESTVFRASYEYFMSGCAQVSGTVEVQLLFSMGPHKAHRF